MADQKKLVESITVHKFLSEELEVDLLHLHENTAEIVRHAPVGRGVRHYEFYANQDLHGCDYQNGEDKLDYTTVFCVNYYRQEVARD